MASSGKRMGQKWYLPRSVIGSHRIFSSKFHRIFLNEGQFIILDAVFVIFFVAQHDIFFIWRITTKQAAGLETWDYDESTYVIIENRSVLLDRSVDIQGF